MEQDIYLWAGINWNSADADEINGGGRNAPVDVLPIDTALVFSPLVASAAIWSQVDATPAHEGRIATVRREDRIMRVSGP